MLARIYWFTRRNVFQNLIQLFIQNAPRSLWCIMWRWCVAWIFCIIKRKWARREFFKDTEFLFWCIMLLMDAYIAIYKCTAFFLLLLSKGFQSSKANIIDGFFDLEPCQTRTRDLAWSNQHQKTSCFQLFMWEAHILKLNFQKK